MITNGLDWRRPRGCADNACPEVAVSDGMVSIRSSERPEEVARLTVEEMRGLAVGWAAGDFADLADAEAAPEVADAFFVAACPCGHTVGSAVQSDIALLMEAHLLEAGGHV